MLPISPIDPNNVPLASLISQEKDQVDVNFLNRNNFNNNAYRNNFGGNNYKPYPPNNGNSYGNSYGNSCNLQTFYAGLNFSSRILLDSAVGGTFKSTKLFSATKLLDEMMTIIHNGIPKELQVVRKFCRGNFLFE